MHASPGIPHITSQWDYGQALAWISDTTMNEMGCDWYDLVLHYKYDNYNILVNDQGWNPDDDFDGDYCIEPGEGAGGQPSDPLRTAQCASDAEMIEHAWDSDRDWNLGKVAGDCYLDMTSDRTAADFAVMPLKGSHLDEGPFEPYYDFGFDSTFTYLSGDRDSSHMAYYFDKMFFVPNFTVELEDKINESTVVTVNMVSPLYTCVTGQLRSAKEWALEYIENIFDECWIVTGNPSYIPLLTKNRREDWLNCPYLDYMEEGKGYIFNGYNPSADDRGKLFTLATFYMINHQMAFYYYRTHRHAPDDDYVWDWQWNPYVEFDVGQPTTNMFLMPDFQGNYDTNLYFVYEDDDYEILGREYLRGDGKRVLVLTKIMASGKTEGEDETTHCLPGFYKKVLPDLSLGDPTDEVSLVNNDGAILVKDDTYSIPFTNIEWDPNTMYCTLEISWDTPGIDCKGKAVLYGGSFCTNYLATKYESQYGESHSLTFTVEGGQFYSAKIYAKTRCLNYEAEGNCHSCQMPKCEDEPPIPVEP